MEHIKSIPCNPTEQIALERSNITLKDMLNKHKGVIKNSQKQITQFFINSTFPLAKMLVEKERQLQRDIGEQKQTVELNKYLYFKNVFTSEKKPGYVFRWEIGFAFVSMGEEKLWIQSRLIKIRSKQERPLAQER